MLPALQQGRKRWLILDLTGCSALDETGAHGPDELSAAAGLLGVHTVLTGINFSLAQGCATASLSTRSAARSVGGGMRGIAAAWWVVLVGCTDGVSAYAPKPEAVAKPEAEAVAKPAEVAVRWPSPLPPPRPGEPGAAYLAMRDGVVRLDGDGFTRLPGDTEAVYSLQIGGDGRLWALGRELWVYTGEAMMKLPDSPVHTEYGMISGFSATPGGEVWTTELYHIGRWDGAVWTMFDWREIGGDEQLFGVHVDPSGDLLITSNKYVRFKSGGARGRVDLGTFDRIYPAVWLDPALMAPDRSTYGLDRRGLLRVAPGGGEVTRVFEPDTSIHRLALASDGSIAACGASRVYGRRSGGAWRTWRANGGDFRGEEPEWAAPDDRGRVWVAANNGVSVLGPGDEVTEWPAGSVPALSEEVTSIAVVGAGPELPASREVVTGKIRGKLTLGREPLVGCEVELCASLEREFVERPCERARLTYTGETDEKGRWIVRDVPLGSYGVSVRVRGRWEIAAFTRPYGRMIMRANEVFEYGPLDVSPGWR